MPICRIMIGLPASGKDTYCNELRPLGWVINSSDDINASTKSELHGVYKDLYRRAKSTPNGHIIISYFKSLFTTELTNGVNNGTYWILIEEGYRNTTWEPHISTPTTNIVINSGSDGNRTYKANWVAN